VPAIGITGGVATGKSSFLQALMRYRPAEAFDADRSVHQLLASDCELVTLIREAFGPAVCRPDGSIDRAALRERVFDDPPSRSHLESLIHPRVRQQWEPLARQARDEGKTVYLDIPLMYETGAEAECDCVVVVACSPATQRRRLQENRGLAPEVFERIISAQLDLSTKVSRADAVVWNDGPPSLLERQAALFATYLLETYV
jgi:dephospho-CoA kinase